MSGATAPGTKERIVLGSHGLQLQRLSNRQKAEKAPLGLQTHKALNGEGEESGEQAEQVSTPAGRAPLLWLEPSTCLRSLEPRPALGC